MGEVRSLYLEKRFCGSMGYNTPVFHSKYRFRKALARLAS
jgi:hypothetical protein